MTYVFYVVNPAHLPGSAAAAVTPERVQELIRSHGAEWGRQSAPARMLGAVMQVLDTAAGTDGLLRGLARKGSPHNLLLRSALPWTLGYFPAELVPHLQAVVRAEAGRIAATLAGIGDLAEVLGYRMTSALEEAALRGAAVAILHED